MYLNLLLSGLYFRLFITDLIIFEDFLRLLLCSINKSWWYWRSTERNKWWSLFLCTLHCADFPSLSLPLVLVTYSLFLIFLFLLEQASAKVSYCDMVCQFFERKTFIIQITCVFMESAKCTLCIIDTKKVVPINLCILVDYLLKLSLLMSPVGFCDTGGVNFAVLMLPAMWNMAKWSDILVHNMPWVCPYDISILLENIWSIRVAKYGVILVGLVMRRYTL